MFCVGVEPYSCESVRNPGKRSTYPLTSITGHLPSDQGKGQASNAVSKESVVPVFKLQNTFRLKCANKILYLRYIQFSSPSCFAELEVLLGLPVHQPSLRRYFCLHHHFLGSYLVKWDSMLKFECGFLCWHSRCYRMEAAYQTGQKAVMECTY